MYKRRFLNYVMMTAMPFLMPPPMSAFAPGHMGKTTVGLADLWNEWDFPTLDPQTHTVGPSGMRFVYAGNALSCLPAQVTDDYLINPFYGWQTWTSGADPVNPTTIVYDASTNVTYVTLSGGPLGVPPPAPGSGFLSPTEGDNGGNPPSYHFGENQGYESECPDNPLLEKQWLWQTATGAVETQNIPFAYATAKGAKITAKNIKLAKAAVLYIGTTEPAATGTWYWVSYVPGSTSAAPSFILKNNGTASLTFGTVGIVSGLAQPTDTECYTNPSCPESEEILDTLNNASYAAPGQANSPFTLLSKLNGVKLAPGKSITITQ